MSSAAYLFIMNVTCGGDKGNKAFAEAGHPIHDCPVSAGGREGEYCRASTQSIVCAFHVGAV